MEADDGGLPETSRSDILQALEEFDEEHRGEGRWADWQSNHKHAIEHEGRLYPVKQIVSMATGRPARSFSGSEQANSYVREYDFDVTRLRSQPLREALKEVLDIYAETHESEPFGKTDDDGEKRRIWKLFKEIEELLEESSVLSQRPHAHVSWTLGRGRWVHGPWFAFLDERVTSTVREGFYPSFGLKPERSKINVGYILGLDQVREKYGAQVGTAILQNRAERLRGRSLQLEDEGFTVPDGPAQKGNQLKVIARKSYEEDEIPSDEELLSDLDVLLQTYDRHVSRQTTGFSIDVDRSRLNAAVDNIIRTAILERKDLEDNDYEGYQHQKIIPSGTSKLTPEALSESPRESVIRALRADVNLLSGNWQKSPAIKFFKRADRSAIQDEVSNLLYGAEELADRVERFMGWGEEREIEDGKTAGLGGTAASYLLFLSDPQQYAFCKTARAYRPAVKALLGDEEVRSDWPERVAHARDFYKETLKIFREEHGLLPFSDLMHVHIAFYLAENEDSDAPWGEGTVETDRKVFSVPEGPPLDGRRIVKIAPGEGAKLWDDCKENGHIRVGWQDVGDLQQFESEEEFQEAFERVFLGSTYDDQAITTKKASEVWTLRELEPGDLVVANRGKSEVLAVGTVVEPGYEWKPDYDGYNHAVNVDWDTSYAQGIPQESYWGMVTVQELSDEDLIERILNPSSSVPKQSYQPPPFEKIYESVREKGMVIDRRTLRRYHVSLRTRGFVILSGVSGTGKTWLTKLYADAINAKRLLQPVAPNWTTDEDLLGYYNPVEGKYHHTEVSRFLREAEEAYRETRADGRAPPPYHLVLDEMNLARVEYYFATLLSKMEKRKREGTATLQLGPETEVLLPPNFSFIGTVNIDETTHSFADKVYDRAQLIEMKAPEKRLREHLGEEPYAGVLMDVLGAIGGVAPFAFRVLDEIAEYVSVARDHGSSWEEALDEQLLQKVLPKVKGTEPKVGEALSEFLEAVPEESYPLSHAKAQSMLEDFRTHGFTSYF
jgi:hypothetical protein